MLAKSHSLFVQQGPIDDQGKAAEKKCQPDAPAQLLRGQIMNYLSGQESTQRKNGVVVQGRTESQAETQQKRPNPLICVLVAHQGKCDARYRKTVRPRLNGVDIVE